ncbi:Transcription antitermination factor NusG [Chitinophaga ginsengisegetis]|uniref:Transcription antitermination factor NusG n=1 Tax=Chitinophaga ginsengisegetis TaxID=393003 RepID=A0A1T5PCY1_9BACT|nr:UpxY family transcription antiterminator [Chitinophaga ginsengisegetis]SKD10522.1 Transcription antitermination factor NusG [Chitinophaga ginsengisegetis]
MRELALQQTVCSWYVVYTYPHYEKRILNQSKKIGIHCFLPTKKVVKQWSDRRKIVDEPLFPNYVFVYVEEQARFRLLDITGVSRYVAFDGKPVVVSEEEMNTIKKLMIEPEVTVERELQSGSKVLITEGPFIGIEGVIFQKKGKTRFGVRIPVLNHSISVEIPASSFSRI